MKRRLLALVLACATVAATMPMTACDKQNVLDNVQRFAPAVTNLLTIACEFAVSPLCATGAPLLNAAEQHLFVVWQGWLDLEKSGGATESAWTMLNAALQDLISKSSDVFALAHVVNGTHQKEVLDVAAAVQGLLAVIEAFLPPAPQKSLMMAQARPRLATFLPPPNAKTKKYDAGWLKDWQKHYNALPAVEARKLQIRSGIFSRL